MSTPVPTISMLMAAYNPGRYVEAAIQPALAQMLPGDELVYQDGGSDDGSLERVRAMAEADPRLTVESGPDRGQSDALNIALARAGGELIGWLNADDVLLPGALEAVRATAATVAPGTVLSGWHQVLDADGNALRSYTHEGMDRDKLFRLGCYVFSGSLFIPRELFLRLGGLVVPAHYSMDLDVMLRIVDTPGVQQAVVPAYLGALRWHATSKSGSVPWRFVSDGWATRRRHIRSTRELVLSVQAVVVSSAAIASTPLRHSDLYRRVRGARKTA